MKTISRTDIDASLDRMDQEQMERVSGYIRALLQRRPAPKEDKRRKAMEEIKKALQAGS